MDKACEGGASCKADAATERNAGHRFRSRLKPGWDFRTDSKDTSAPLCVTPCRSARRGRARCGGPSGPPRYFRNDPTISSPYCSFSHVQSGTSPSDGEKCPLQFSPPPRICFRIGSHCSNSSLGISMSSFVRIHR